MNQTQANRVATAIYFFKHELSADEVVLARWAGPSSDAMYSPNHCGAVGCFAGWLPVIFPEDFYYHESWGNIYISYENGRFICAHSHEKLISYFGIADEQGLVAMLLGKRPMDYKGACSDREAVVDWLQNELKSAGY